MQYYKEVNKKFDGSFIFDKSYQLDKNDDSFQKKFKKILKKNFKKYEKKRAEIGTFGFAIVLLFSISVGGSQKNFWAGLITFFVLILTINYFKYLVGKLIKIPIEKKEELKNKAEEDMSHTFNLGEYLGNVFEIFQHPVTQREQIKKIGMLYYKVVDNCDDIKFCLITNGLESIFEKTVHITDIQHFEKRYIELSKPDVLNMLYQQSKDLLLERDINKISNSSILNDLSTNLKQIENHNRIIDKKKALKKENEVLFLSLLDGSSFSINNLDETSFNILLKKIEKEY